MSLFEAHQIRIIRRNCTNDIKNHTLFAKKHEAKYEVEGPVKLILVFFSLINKSLITLKQPHQINGT